MNLNFFVGTAAELIKIYPVLHLARAEGHNVRVISSGQSGENFRLQAKDFALGDDVVVNLMDNAQDLHRARSAIRWVLRALTTRKRNFRAKLLPGEARGFVLVHGDTLSTLIGAWLGWRAGVTVVHVEAGLRSPHLFKPFPEEFTRRLVSRFVDVHMAPDRVAEQNLRRSHVGGRVVCTGGNTLMDALPLVANFGENGAPTGASKTHSGANGGRYALVNVHRFENLNSPARWSQILDAVVQASEKTRLIFVTHPQTRHRLEKDPAARALLEANRIEIRGRLPFSEFIGLLKNAAYLITDGGSNQEECFYMGKPCLILRESTERSEGLNTCCLLSQFDGQKIARFLSDPEAFAGMPLALGTSPSRLLLETLNLDSPTR